MAPVIKALREQQGLSLTVCATAQHRQMLDQVLRAFDLRVDVNLDIMRPNQSLAQITSRTLEGLGALLEDIKPAWLVVQGDTTTAFAAALAGYYNRVAVAHVEAGLRTNQKYSPYPEEVNRRAIAVLADAHFAPTQSARENLLRENVPSERIWVTGNTGIDALHQASALLEARSEMAADISRRFSFLTESKKLILLTAHRRESFGAPLEKVCIAVREIVRTRSDIQVVYPVHLNPNVRGPVERLLAKATVHPAVEEQAGCGGGTLHLLEPVDYFALVYLLKRACLVLTDSGGIQEEAASLGKPVLVLRENTERPEGVQAGVAKAVGTEPSSITANVVRLLDNPSDYQRMARSTAVYGDGRAAQRILDVLKTLHPAH